MRVIFMGSPQFAVPTLEAIVAAGHEVVGVVAQPDKPRGRGKKMQSPPVAVRGRELGLDVRQPRAVKRGPFPEWMEQVGADVAVVVAYGRILTPRLLAAPKLGCVNVHGSLLPAYRGAAPVQWSVINGDAETGVVTMMMEEGLDTGPVLLERRVPIEPDETSGALFERMAPLGAEVLVETLARLPDLEPQPQDETRATSAPLLSKEDGRMNWSKSALQLHNHVRGMHPWPGAWTSFRDQVLKVHRARTVDGSGAPGTVIEGATVAAGAGALELLEVQLPGKPRRSGRDFVNGSRPTPGESLS